MESDILQESVASLKAGGVVLHRPDTIWGLSADATQESAVKRLSALKGRPADKSYIILVRDVAMMERFVREVPEVAYDLLDNAVNPLTIIYPEGIGLASGVCADDASVAIRVSQDEWTQKIIQRLNRPIISTSANLSGQASPKEIEGISDAIRSQVDYIIRRPQKHGSAKASTIIKLALNGEFEIIRS